MDLFYGIAGLDYGTIVSETGNMYSGKTSALISRLEKIKRIDGKMKEAAERENKTYRPLTIGVYKHHIDDRYSSDKVVTHNGISIAAKPIKTVKELINDVTLNNYRIVAVDEVQFFDELNEDGRFEIEYALKKFADEKRYVIVAGLDVDFRGLTFGPMGNIIAISEEKGFHKSICAVCGAPATLPQRLINGKPAYFDDPIKLVGANDSYEPRCRVHHVVLHREEIKQASNS